MFCKSVESFCGIKFNTTNQHVDVRDSGACRAFTGTAKIGTAILEKIGAILKWNEGAV